MVIRPALADQRGSAFFISTPVGYNHFHEMWEQAAELEDWQTFSFSTIEGGNVPPEEVELARRTLDERTFKQEFLASFETFRAACSQNSTTPTLPRSRTWVALCSWAWISTLGDGRGDLLQGRRHLHQWDEIAVKNSNTDEVASPPSNDTI